MLSLSVTIITAGRDEGALDDDNDDDDGDGYGDGDREGSDVQTWSRE